MLFHVLNVQIRLYYLHSVLLLMGQKYIEHQHKSFDLRTCGFQLLDGLLPSFVNFFSTY